MTTLQDYDLEIKPWNIVIGKGLCWLATEASNSQPKEEPRWKNEESMFDKEIYFIVGSIDSWCHNLTYYLIHGYAPQHLDSQK